MKKILLLVLFPLILFAQSGKSVLTQAQKDSIQAMIDASGGSSGDFVDKTSLQTITGQKNFSGTVKVGSDTSIILGYMDGTIRTGLHINQLAGHPYGQNRIFKVVPLNPLNASWSLITGIADFTTGGIYDHTFTLGYNSDNELADLKFGQQMEATYDVNDTTLISEWFSYYNSTPTSTAYSVRPFQLSTTRYGSSAPYRYTSSVNINADAFQISGEANNFLIEFRTQTYGATATQDDKWLYGSLQNALGNSMMYIADSLWIFHDKNNFGWLYQADKNGSARELMRIDNNGIQGHVLIAPSTNNDIDFGSPIYGSIDWRNNDTTGVISIYKETGTNRIVVGGNDGMVTNKIEVINIQQDTIGLGQSQFYIEPLTGSVQYTMPENLVTNGSFTDWSGTGKSATPDGWTFNPDPRDTTAIYIEQSPTGKLHYVWDGSSAPAISYVLQSTSSIGTTYGYSFQVDAITDSALVYVVGNGITITSTGTYSGSFESVADEKFKIIHYYGAGEITLDNMRLWEVGGNITAPPYDVPVILDSLGQLANVDSAIVNNLIGTYIDTVASDTSTHTMAEIDKAVDNTLYSVIKLNPTSSSTFTLLRTKAETIVDSVFCLVQGASASVDFNIAYGTDRTSGTDIFASDQTADNVTVGETFSTFSSATIPVNNMIWLDITTATNTPTEFLCVIYYH